MNNDITTVIKKLDDMQTRSEKRFDQLHDAVKALNREVSINSSKIKSLTQMTQEGFAKLEERLDVMIRRIGGAENE